jgi:hypothetical protein
MVFGSSNFQPTTDRRGARRAFVEPQLHGQFGPLHRDAALRLKAAKVQAAEENGPGEGEKWGYHF